MLRFDRQLGSDKYVLGRVSKLIPDKHERVRTVIICLRNNRKGAREGPRTCKAGTCELQVAVQRLVVILPVEDQNQSQ